MPVRAPELCNAAQRFADKLQVKNFNASDERLSWFAARHDISSKRTVGERCRADYESVKPFVEEIRKIK